MGNGGNMTTEDHLFSGEPYSTGGLSNEDELARICPVEFKNRHNPWVSYASRLFFEGGIISHWKWRSDGEEKENQFRIFQSILEGFMSHSDKEAVAGWMLSRMLFEVPEYIPLDK